MDTGNPHKVARASPAIRVGDTVRVRDLEDIVQTLDNASCTESLPFMPEMQPYCGKTFTVSRCVNRILVEGHGIRRLCDSFILEGVRCDGTSHNGCQRSCSVIWKKDWLTVEQVNRAAQSPLSQVPSGAPCHLSLQCQGLAKTLIGATEPLSALDIGQYLMDVRQGNYSFSGVLLMLVRMATDRLAWKLRRAWRRVRARKAGYRQAGQPLPLMPGDTVEVRSAREIQATLNKDAKFQGILFADPMWLCCGKQFRVSKAVERVFVEDSGAFRLLRDTYLLENVTCDGRTFRGCPRNCYWYWKSAWLKKAEGST